MQLYVGIDFFLQHSCIAIVLMYSCNFLDSLIFRLTSTLTGCKAKEKIPVQLDGGRFFQRYNCIP